MVRAYNYSEDCEPRFYQDIFVKHEYDFGIPDKKDMIVVDIGAHVGLFTEYISPKAKRIFSIEPSTGNYQRLVKRIQDKHLPALPFHNAIGDKTEYRKLYSCGKDGDFSLKYQTPESEEVVAISFDDFIYTNKIEHIDLLKIDTEGAEEEIIMSEGFKKYAHIVDALVGEVHVNVNIARINQRMVELGFKVGYINNLFSFTR